QCKRRKERRACRCSCRQGRASAWCAPSTSWAMHERNPSTWRLPRCHGSQRSRRTHEWWWVERGGSRVRLPHPMVLLPEAPRCAAPGRISWEGTTASITCAVPGRLPSDATVELVVRSSDAARAVARIDLRPGEAASAELTAQPSGRTARVRALVRDRFGNALGPSDFAFG